MNIDTAWQDFEKTGKIDNYLKYIRLKRNLNKNFNEEIGIIEGENSEVIQGKGDSN